MVRPQRSPACRAIARGSGVLRPTSSISAMARPAYSSPSAPMASGATPLPAASGCVREAPGPTEAAAGDGVRPDALGAEGEEYAGLAIALIDEVSRSTPDPRAMARQAGERWGRTMAQRRPDPTAGIAPSDRTDPSGAVVDMLTGLRFEPQPAATPGTVRLTTCPLLDAARRNPDVVCEVHLGIVRGALTRFGGDPDAVDLIPFAEPGACLLTLPSRQ
jgi:hypothetical protein